jgi:multisubunit Na+/H+ antiporter MnhB subunit
MSKQDKAQRARTSAILNIAAGVLFLVAAFNLLTGEPGINWMYMIVGVLFIGGGIWGLRQ